MFTSPRTHAPILYILASLLPHLLFTSLTALRSKPHTRNLAISSTVRYSPASCGGFCRFSICNLDGPTRDPFIILGPPHTAFNRFICLENESNPLVPPFSTGDPQISDANQLIPLSEWSPAGLSPSFGESFFEVRQLITAPAFLNGIAPQPTRGNQWSFLHNRCFVLPLTSFTIKDTTGQMVTRSSTDPHDCVAFETRAPTLHLFMVWESNGDGDILLQEPSRNIVDFLNPRLESGARLNGDNGVDICNLTDIPGYTESIMYFPGTQPISGPYVVEAWQASDCGRINAETDWSLMVIRNGKVTPSEIISGTVTSNGNYTRAGAFAFGF